MARKSQYANEKLPLATGFSPFRRELPSKGGSMFDCSSSSACPSSLVHDASSAVYPRLQTF